MRYIVPSAAGNRLVWYGEWLRVSAVPPNSLILPTQNVAESVNLAHWFECQKWAKENFGYFETFGLDTIIVRQSPLWGAHFETEDDMLLFKLKFNRWQIFE
jgi:hypothetical protein